MKFELSYCQTTILGLNGVDIAQVISMIKPHPMRKKVLLMLEARLP